MKYFALILIVICSVVASDLLPYGQYWALGGSVGAAFSLGEYFGKKEASE
jgi:hypothetical protein